MKIKYFGRVEIFMAVLSALMLFVIAMMTKTFFEDSIETHDSNWMSVRGNSYINITYIDPEPIATDIDGTNLYLAGYRLSDQLTDYFILQADPNSKETKSLLVNADNLENKPQRVLGSQNGSKPNQTIKDIVAKTSQSPDIDSEILLYFNEEDYFSTSDLENPTASLIQAIGVTLAIYAVFGALPNIFVWSHYRRAKEAAKSFFDVYPELMGDLKNIEHEASYLEEAVGLAIYKDHLVAFNHLFSTADLRNTKSIDISGWGNKVMVGRRYRLLFWILRATFIRTKGDSKKDKKVLLAHHLLDQPIAKEQFVSAIEEYSPAITITVR